MLQTQGFVDRYSFLRAEALAVKVFQPRCQPAVLSPVEIIAQARPPGFVVLVQGRPVVELVALQQQFHPATLAPVSQRPLELIAFRRRQAEARHKR
jgi:hypothetical protein